MMELRENSPQLVRFSLQDRTSHMRTTIREMGDNMIDAPINQSIEAVGIDLKIYLTTIRMGIGETTEGFLVLHLLKGQISHKMIHTANQKLINVTTLPSAVLTMDLRLVLHPANRNAHKTITRRHLMWFASPQQTIPSMKHQTFSAKLLRSPNSNTDKSRNSRPSLNSFYFATGGTQKDRGLEIEFMLDTVSFCSIINYRTFWEICQLQYPVTLQKSPKVTKTYSRQTVPMIGYATITFSYEPDGQFIFPLTVWITEMRTQNLLGTDFCQKQGSGVYFDLPGIEIKNPPKTICYGNLNQNKSYPHLSPTLTNRTPYTMCVDARSARCWKYSHTDNHKHFPPDSTFQPNRNAVASGLSFINTLCTRS